MLSTPKRDSTPFNLISHIGRKTQGEEFIRRRSSTFHFLYAPKRLVPLPSGVLSNDRIRLSSSIVYLFLIIFTGDYELFRGSVPDADSLNYYGAVIFPQFSSNVPVRGVWDYGTKERRISAMCNAILSMAYSSKISKTPAVKTRRFDTLFELYKDALLRIKRGVKFKTIISTSRALEDFEFKFLSFWADAIYFNYDGRRENGQGNYSKCLKIVANILDI